MMLYRKEKMFKAKKGIVAKIGLQMALMVCSHVFFMKFDAFNESCITMSIEISIFRLICIVMTLVMQSFV